MSHSRVASVENLTADPLTPSAWILARVGETWFGVAEKEIWSIARDAPLPTPLPHTPPAVLGVSLIRQRAFTVVNLQPLLTTKKRQRKSAVAVKSNSGETAELSLNMPVILALRGDAQIAFAADAIETVAAEDVGKVTASKPPPHDSLQLLTDQMKTANGRTYYMLDADTLFALAVQRGDRRRRRAR